MFDDLVSNIIKKLLAMPKLAISETVKKEFFARCNHICTYHELSVARFDNHFLQFPETVISKSEKYAFANYISLVNEIIKDVDLIINIMTYSCIELLGASFDGEIMIPLFIKILSLFPNELSSLEKVLGFCAETNCRYRYFAALEGVTSYLLDANNSTQSSVLSDHDIEIQNKVNALLEKLRDPEFFPQPFFVAKISTFCRSRMNECYHSIYQNFHTNNFHDFDDNSASLDEIDKFKEQNSSILKISNNGEHPFLINHPEIWKNIKKHIAYFEFYATFCYRSASNFNKLLAFIHKYPNFQEQLGDDIVYAYISLPADIKNYLKIEDTYTGRAASLLTFSFLWQTPYETKVTFGTFMDALVNKIKSLELEADVQLSVAAPPVTPA